MRAATKGVLGPVAVKAQKLKAVFGETVSLEPIIKVASDPPTMLCAVPMNMVNGEKSQFFFRTADALVSISRKDLRTKTIPKLQSFFLFKAPPLSITNVPKYLLAGSTIRSIAMLIMVKTNKAKNTFASCASTFSRFLWKLPIFSSTRSTSSSASFRGSIGSASAAAADNPFALNYSEMSSQKYSLARRAPFVRFHSHHDYIVHVSENEGVAL